MTNQVRVFASVVLCCFLAAHAAPLFAPGGCAASHVHACACGQAHDAAECDCCGDDADAAGSQVLLRAMHCDSSPLQPATSSAPAQHLIAEHLDVVLVLPDFPPTDTVEPARRTGFAFDPPVPPPRSAVAL